MVRFTKLGLPLFLIVLNIVACSRHLVVTKQAYKQYEIDNSLPSDSTYVRYYQPYKLQLDTEMKRVIGHSDVRLSKPASVPETLLGNFFADALLEEGRILHPDIDFSFGTKGGLRIELPKGAITIGLLFELMPFENELVLLELSAENVEQVAQFIAGSGGQPVAGMRMTIRDGRAEDIRVGDEPIDPTRTYKLLTYDYLANGGDNLRGLDHPISRIDLGKKVREALIDYVGQLTQAGKHITTQLDGRITRD